MMGMHMAALQQAQDRDAIEALQWRYDRALDTFNADKYVALYTEDGSFGQVKGREALRKMMGGFTGPRPAAAGQAAAPAGPPKLQHATSNDWIEFHGPDSATIHYYWQTYALSSSGKLDDPPKLLAAGNGVDEVVKQNGQWLFKSRRLRLRTIDFGDARRQATSAYSSSVDFIFSSFLLTRMILLRPFTCEGPS